ncbi:simple sugar transport system permease protein [Lachnospiraceae bacterium PF1-21]|uniref:ABC transporter permease n=1 Tax=Ohessyouella blattaphilus TaxID=2949333 RepID=A0ABT1EGJ9_9FIRM|nr:ABC transporter permease [Ohessyouella blattaphilus]MCP1109818.1 ABC transporter permease [Ohessyouella blattaphilus]MCR8563212.1 ABC transporter permease [Ohessyouella blattaphilus]MDL2250519.1 ABC transporter permease [Lachnospiraceae bacterium OttesenSCG-928-J05]
MAQVKKAIDKFGLPRIIILVFFFVLIITAGVLNMNVPALLGDVIRRWGMYGILVLAMVPGIQCGIGPNFGVTIGISGGLLGALISIELRDKGFFENFSHNATLDAFMGIFVALLLALIFASVFGILYGMLLNRVKGSEMTVSTYVGFSVVALFNILWLVLPFRSKTSIWPLAGDGLRNTISLEADYKEVFNNFLGFKIGGIYIPTGLLLIFFLACFCVWLFLRSRNGIMMSAAGANPVYAKAAGINVDKMRILGTTLSTALGGIGIVMYAQSFGFLQLYNATQMMGFSCVASVLIGGASINRASIINVLIGTFLFQGILAVALPVANMLLPEGQLSEILRIIISNGIILYALSKSKGGTR